MRHRNYRFGVCKHMTPQFVYSHHKLFRIEVEMKNIHIVGI